MVIVGGNPIHMYLAFDVETTDLPKSNVLPWHASQPYIMQLGAVLYDEQFNQLDELNVLLRLPPAVQPAAKAFEAHGITADMCSRQGITPEAAHDRFNDLADRAQHVIAHNFQFDQKLMQISAIRYHKPLPFTSKQLHCTMTRLTPIMQLASKYPGKYKWPNLQEAHVFCTGKRFDGAHDAMADVRAVGEIWKWLNRPHAASEALGGPSERHRGGNPPGTHFQETSLRSTDPRERQRCEVGQGQPEPEPSPSVPSPSFAKSLYVDTNPSRLDDTVRRTFFVPILAPKTAV